MFCKICLVNWKNYGNKNCPCCKQKIQEEKLNKILIKMLDKIIIKECPNQCGRKKMTYQTFVETHLMKECPKLYVKCCIDGCG